MARAGQPFETPMEGVLSRSGRPAGRPIGPPHSAEAGRSLQEEGQPSRCFLRPSSLPPGHDPSIPEMSIRHKRFPDRAGDSLRACP